MIGGDFNVVLNEEENIRGIPILDTNTDDFNTFIECCDLLKCPSKGALLVNGMVELVMTAFLRGFIKY